MLGLELEAVGDGAEQHLGDLDPVLAVYAFICRYGRTNQDEDGRERYGGRKRTDRSA